MLDNVLFIEYQKRGWGLYSDHVVVGHYYLYSYETLRDRRVNAVSFPAMVRIDVCDSISVFPADDATPEQKSSCLSYFDYLDLFE